MRDGQNIEMYAGDDLHIEVKVVDAAGDPFDDLVDATVEWFVKRSEISKVATLKKKSPASIGIGDGGRFSFYISRKDSLSMPPRLYYHGATVTIGGLRRTVMTGKLLLKPNVGGT